MAIRSFGDDDTRELFVTGHSKQWAPIAKVACRKLDMLDAAFVLADLFVPPGNRLERLRGDRAGQHSIRINDQYRVCFTWSDNGPEDVEIVDYH